MGLKIFGDDPADLPQPRANWSDDLVGRFRSGMQVDGEPYPLTEWRLTTGDPDVAAAVHRLFGGVAPATWETSGDDNIEVLTEATDIAIVIESPAALRQRMVMFTEDGKLLGASDGEFMFDDHGKLTKTPDADRALGFADRKAKGQAGTGPNPDIDLYFRLADDPDLGIFQLKSNSWRLAKDLIRDGVETKLAKAGNDAKATLSLEQVSFVPRGEEEDARVTFTATRIKVKAVAK